MYWRWVELIRREKDDFIGADTARKFIQMGRTRSLRYALRPGGKKYEHDDETGEKKEIKRTGEVHDQGKLDGAGVFAEVLKRCWEDGWYQDAFERWKNGVRDGGVKAEHGAGGAARSGNKKTEDWGAQEKERDAGGGVEELVEVKEEDE